MKHNMYVPLISIIQGLAQTIDSILSQEEPMEEKPENGTLEDNFSQITEIKIECIRSILNVPEGKSIYQAVCSAATVKSVMNGQDVTTVHSHVSDKDLINRLNK